MILSTSSSHTCARYREGQDYPPSRPKFRVYPPSQNPGQDIYPPLSQTLAYLLKSGLSWDGWPKFDIIPPLKSQVQTSYPPSLKPKLAHVWQQPCSQCCSWPRSIRLSFVCIRHCSFCDCPYWDKWWREFLTWKRTSSRYVSLFRVFLNTEQSTHYMYILIFWWIND